MVPEFVRVGAGAVASPLLWAGKAIRRAALGSAVVLDVVVEPLPDLVSREAFLGRLRLALADPDVVGFVLRMEGVPGGWATVGEMIAWVDAARAAGKRVLAYLESPGSAMMAIAARCDSVALLPTGEVAVLGVGTELTFFGQALERLGLRPDFLAAGAYKSFGEPFTRSFPSPDNQHAMGELVQGLHDRLIQTIAEGRARPVEQIEGAVLNSPLSAQDALERGLVDSLLYDDEVEGWVKDQLGRGVRRVDFAAWSRAETAFERVEQLGRGGKAVVVVPLAGSIVVDGPRSRLAIRARQVVPILKKLREDDAVGAVVLHVDSPGGSALASDLIWREVNLLRQKKPVVAVFADVSASGGYYLAAPAHAILARYGTLTGSIGVFGGKIVVGEGLRKLGITSWPVVAGPNANLYSAARPFDDSQRARFRASLQRFYDGFVERVAAGRGRTVDEVEPSCRGRVWTGEAALERGLIDEIGGVDEGILRAARLAGLGSAPRVAWARMAAGTGWQRLVRRALPALADAGGVSWAATLLPPVDLEQAAMAASGEPLALWPYLPATLR